jgi:hypothetical protein
MHLSPHVDAQPRADARGRDGRVREKLAPRLACRPTPTIPQSGTTIMKKPLLGSEELLGRVKQALTPNRLPLLIVIDGADGCGKSSLASWLAWQLGMPAVQMDLYLTNLHPMQWLTSELARVVNHRIDNNRPVIVDGVCALDVVDHIKREANFLVFLRGGNEGSSLAPQILVSLPQTQTKTAD